MKKSGFLLDFFVQKFWIVFLDKKKSYFLCSKNGGKNPENNPEKKIQNKI